VNLGSRIGIPRPAHRAAGGAATVASILGASLFEWHRADQVEPTGGATGFFRWPDLSGNGRHCDAPLATNSPTTGTDAFLNGRAVVVFDGVNDHLMSVAPASAYTPFHDGTTVAIWCVYRMRSVVSAASKTVIATSQTVAANGFNLQHISQYAYGFAGNGTAQTVAIITDISEMSSRIRLTRMGTALTPDFTDSSDTASYDTNSSGNYSASPGSGTALYTLKMGRSGIGADWADMNLAEVILAVNPTAQQVAEVSALLSTYYAPSDSVANVLGAALFEHHRADSTTTNGSGRFRWTDLSGNGRHADSPSAAADPATGVDAGLNGQPVVTFDGSSDYLVNVAPASDFAFLHQAGIWALWAVHRFIGTPTLYGGMYGTCDAAIGLGTQLDMSGAANELFGGIGNGAANVAAHLPVRVGSDNVGKVAVFRSPTGSSSSLQMRFTQASGLASVVSSAADSVGRSAATPPVSTAVIGKRVTGAQHFQGNMAEIIVAQAPSASQVAAVNGLLNTRYALTTT